MGSTISRSDFLEGHGLPNLVGCCGRTSGTLSGKPRTPGCKPKSDVGRVAERRQFTPRKLGLIKLSRC